MTSLQEVVAPNSVIEWIWWIFTAIILAFVLSIVSGLATPVFKERGEGWFQKRRLKKEKYRESLEKMYAQYENNPNALLLRVAFAILFGFTLINGQITITGGFVLIVINSIRKSPRKSSYIMGHGVLFNSCTLGDLFRRYVLGGSENGRLF